MVRLLVLICLLMTSGAFASGGGGGGEATGAGVVKLDAIILNLGEGRVMRFSPVLKLNDVKDGEYVKAYTPVLRFELIKSMIGKNAEVVQTVKFVTEFSVDAAELLNKAMRGEYIKEMFFEDWLIQ